VRRRIAADMAYGRQDELLLIRRWEVNHLLTLGVKDYLGRLATRFG